MATDPQVERCLNSIRALSATLVTDLAALEPATWDAPTNCAPWRVRDLAAHIVSSGEGFVANIRQGLAGSVEPPLSDAQRHHRQAELEAADAATVARALQAVTGDFENLYAGLEEPDLSAICFHRRGNRSVRWYAAHRLAEVAFHRWDLQYSLGREPELAEHVAGLLLPTLLESNAPRTYAAGLTPRRGSGERYLLAVDGDPLARWLVQIDPDKLEARRVDPPTDSPSAESPTADLTISGSASILARLVYGRADLPASSESGAVHLQGDPRMVNRFALIFPRP